MKLYVLEAAAKPLTIVTNLDGIVPPTGIDQTPFTSGKNRGEAYKVIRNGLLFIECNGRLYNAHGALMNNE